MPSFVVDPILCTTPATDADPGEVARWFGALEGWLAAQNESPFEWKHFFQCTEALRNIGRFPSFESLRINAQRADVDVVIGSLLQRLTRFFQNETHDLQSATATRCVVLAEDEPVIVPPEVLSRNLTEVHRPLQDGLLCLACDQAQGEAFAQRAHLVTAQFATGSREISIGGTIALGEPEKIFERLSTLTLRQRFPALFSPEELSAFHCEALLAGGVDGFLTLVMSTARSKYPDSPPIASFVGNHFWQSLLKCGITEDTFATGKLLRICAATLAGRLDEINVQRRPKRETESPDSAQQTRQSDNAKAWRLTITRSGAGYRLHYWHTPARGEQPERIEFANVLRETDPVVIPEG